MGRGDSDHRLAKPFGAENETSFWPANLLLCSLGATILAIAFLYLDPHDPRPLYNSWTYVVATPVALMLISLVLHALVVSRVVEKSMQVALLLSLLVHLFFLIGAMNVVIFSRLWPEIIDSMAKQRHLLKREMLRAPQYHRFANSTQTEVRPDYLSFVPTEYHPSELESVDALALALPRSSRNHLLSPTPEVARTANPHSLERQQASPSLPSVAAEATRLSRSQLQDSLKEGSHAEPIGFDGNPISQQVAPKLSASETPATRGQRSASSLPQELTTDFSPAVDSVRAAVPSDADAMRRSAWLAPSPQDLGSAYLPRSNFLRSTRQTRPQLPTEIEVTDSPETQPDFPLLLPASDDRMVDSRRITASPSWDSLSAALPAASLNPRENSSQVISTDLERRTFESQVNEPRMGDDGSLEPRRTTGGLGGPPAPSSMPVQGFDYLAGQQPAPKELISPQLDSVRRNNSGRALAAAPAMEDPQAVTWNGRPSLSGGVSGVSPTQLTEQAQKDPALEKDIASLRDARNAIRRSQTGTNRLSDSLSRPALANEEVAPGALAGNESDSKPTDLDAAESALDRAASPKVSQTANALDATFTEPGPSADTSPPARRASLPEERLAISADLETTSPEVSRSPLDRSSPITENVRVPTAEIDAIVESDAYLKSLPDEVDGSSVKAGRTFTGEWSNEPRSSANLLAIDGPLGSGGIQALNRIGELLPQRSTIRPPDDQLSDLEFQRFARQEIGGPLATGLIALPKPAFQQRLERLQDRNPLENTAAEPQTELAIERGLEFLAKYQREDGSWRLQDFDTEVLMTSDTAATGLALLAFQGAGYTHKQFKYAKVCQRAIQFLRERQFADGDLYIRQTPASDQNAWLYSHAIATIALCESYGMTQDEEIEESAQRAVDFIVASQDPLRGGWRYRPGTGSDTSVSGWFMMALQSAKLAGLMVPQGTFDRLEMYLQASQSPDGDNHLYRYNPYAADTPQQRHGLQPTAVMTSVGLLMRLYTGWQRDRPEMMEGAEYLLENLPAHGVPDNSRRDTYYWYYATQVMFHIGGDRWREWHDALYPLLIEHQVLHGEYEGSWDPMAPTADLWAQYGGRLYVTTMNLLSLEVTYRHLPIYDAAAPEN